MSSKGSSWIKNEQHGSTCTTLVLKRPASPKHSSDNSEPHPIQQVSGPVSRAEVGLRDREQMESVNRNTDIEMIAGNNENLNEDAAQNIGRTRIANGSAGYQSALFGGRRVRSNIGNNINRGTGGQTITDFEAFNEPPTRPCRCCSIM